jgi:hypothetical protein
VAVRWFPPPLLASLGERIRELASRHNPCVSPVGRKVLQISGYEKVSLGGLRALKKHIVIRIGTRANLLQRLKP